MQTETERNKLRESQRYRVKKRESGKENEIGVARAQMQDEKGK